MTEDAAVVESPLVKVVDYADPAVEHVMANGFVNTDDDTIRAQIRSSIRRGHPQMRPGPLRPDRICLVGSGPSLNDSLDELRQLVWDGALLVTVNGAYNWCLKRNLRPQTQIVMDARPSNARFVEPSAPKCSYVIASQCHPDVWDAVAGRENVWIFHAAVKSPGSVSDELDAYYGGQWMPVAGGTTVTSRALMLLRQCGYLRFDLFGIDCCWMDTAHHAFEQPENDVDRRSLISAGANGQPETMREFWVSTWMLRQCEDLLTLCQPAAYGKNWVIHAHGDGLFAHVMRVLGSGSEVDIQRG